MFIFTSLSVVIIGFLFQLIAILMGAVLFRIPLLEFMDLQALDDPHLLSAMKFVQIFGAIGTFIFSSMLLSFLYTGSWLGYFQLKPAPKLVSIVLLSTIMIAGLPLVNYLTEINMNMTIPIERLEEALRSLEEQTEDVMMKMLSAENLGALLVNLVMIAVIPAIGEELLFRGLIQRHLSESFRNAHIAIVVTAVIFSLVHMQIYSFLPRFFLGILLGYMLLIGKSIWYPIIAHFVNNALGVVFYFLAHKQKADETLEEIGTSESLPVLALISLVIVILFILILVKSEKMLQPGRDSDH